MRVPSSPTRSRPRSAGCCSRTSSAISTSSRSISRFYIALLALSPVFVLLARVSRWIALGFSLSLYVVCLIFSINLPTWPIDGAWFFNPLAWQLLLVLGFLSAELARDSEAFWGWMRRLMPLGIIGVAIGIVVAV